MKTLWRALNSLCAAALTAVAVLGMGAGSTSAQTCVELLTDGGFETGAGWQLGPSPVTPQYVTYTKHSGNRSLSLGITSGANVESFSSARQTVAIPAAGAQVLLSFWSYAMADSPATTDYMEVVLLDATGTAILNKPWRSHNDSRVWNQMTFDLTSWRGQTVQIYFNVYNDGVGGRAAMFLDDVSLVSCAAAATVGPTGTVTATATSGPATPTSIPTPGCADLLNNGAFTGGVAGWELQGDPAGTTIATNPVRSAPYALKLGSLDLPLNSLNVARQLVTVPAGSLAVTLEAWVYAQSQSSAGADYQQIALLNASGGLLHVPWQAASNDAAWTRLSFDVSAFRGQSLFVRFAVNNDGGGGRTALFVDDVRLRACSAGVTPTPTTTQTPTMPPETATAVPPGCLELTQNASFEAGYQPWQAGASALPAQLVDDPVHNGAYAMRLGSQTDNQVSYSSIRQTVTVPWGRPRVVVGFWAFTWAEALHGADRQQFVLLGQGGEVWAVPWSVLEDEQAWRQHIFDVVGAAGQSFSLYFNAINDGVGGRTALFVDEVHAWACTEGAYPSLLESGGRSQGEAPFLMLPDPELALALPDPEPAVTLPDQAPAMTLPLDTLSFTAAPDPTANQTRVALAPQTESRAQARILPEEVPVDTNTPAGVNQETGAVAPAVALVRTTVDGLPRGWPLVVVSVVGLLLLVLLRGQRQADPEDR